MLDEIIKERRRKLGRYREFANPYPSSTRRSITVGEVLKKFDLLKKGRKKTTVAGRIRAWRDQGKIIFLDLADDSGRIQVILNGTETKDFEIFKETLETGDFFEATGAAFKTQRGEKSILAREGKLLAKSLRPLPGQWQGLADVETRLRKRYLDILFNPEVKELFLKKSVFWDEVRSAIKQAGFLEVEAPVLESLPGGAEAEPFVTHHNALDQDFYLRISLELPLKKLLVAGYEKVFEIGRVFRNEGIDRDHLQDYTALEFYWAYADYRDLMKFLPKFFRTIIKKTFGTLKIKSQGREVDWSKPWKIYDYYELFRKNTGVDLGKASDDELKRKADDLGLEPEVFASRGRLIDLIYKKAVRSKLIEPGFLIDPPVEIEPLAKRSERDPGRVERLQVMAYGTELGKGFSELNDPIDQRRRFEEQMKLRAAGDKEAQRLDEDFLEAMEYGLPPAAGFGLSDRLFSVLVDRPIRETVIFPLMRKEKNA